MQPYEQQVRVDIEKWKSSEPNPVGTALRVMTSPLDRVSATVLDRTPVGGLLGLLSKLLADFARWTVNDDAAFRKLSNEKVQVASADDIARLEIRTVDDAVGHIRTVYVAVAAVEGGAAGAASTGGPEVGVPALFADIVFLQALALRAICAYGSFYGFPVNSPEERGYAIHALSVAATPKGSAKQAAIRKLHSSAKLLTKKATWEELEKLMGAEVLKELLEAVGIRVTKQKLADLLPVAGAGIGAAFNGWYINQVCDAAYYTYRERFLDRAVGLNGVRRA